MSRKRPHYGNNRRGRGKVARKPKIFLTGTVRVYGTGSAVVETAEGTFPVARQGLREAMGDDTVQVTLVDLHGHAHERVAYVQGVLERATLTFLGTYHRLDPLGAITPLDRRITHDFFVLPEDPSAERCGVSDGDVVSARILEYPTRNSAGVCTIDERRGTAADLDLVVEEVIASYGLPTGFTDAVLEQARDVTVDVDGALADDPRRRDLRDTLCVTVDPADARDFDDAVAATRLTDGGYELWVHIADVTHYLGWDTPMDLEARRRTCSVYLVDRVIPMLPEELSADACSLRPGQDRLTMSVRMTLDEEGRVVASEAMCSAINSGARLTYDEVDALLESKIGPGDLVCVRDNDGVATMLHVLDEIARKRLALRARRGSIDFETTEYKVELAEGGKPVGVKVRRRTAATSMIEEAMLAANESVARMLSERDIACAYRVHEQPSPDTLKATLPALAELGLMGEGMAERIVAADPHAIAEVLEKVAGKPGDYLVNTLLLRAQKRAVYLPDNEGHYALAAPAYCHFTSPIRRYPDVIVHRALKNLLVGNPQTKERTSTEKVLPALCRTCSERERVADAAARDSQKAKMAQYYAERIGMRISGVVAGCERFGLFVVLDDTCAQGFIATRDLGDEWFYYDEDKMTLTGESTGRTYRIGQRLAVEVADTDISKGRIDLVLARSRKEMRRG